MFLIYINHLADVITSTCKVFADDTSPFSKVLDVNKSVIELNDDLEKINQWGYQLKMEFNPDLNQQANEAIFSQKSISNNLSHPPINFNEGTITKCTHQKHQR